MKLLRPVYSVLSPGGGRARLSVFIFHRVLPRPDPFLPGEPDVATFDRMLGWIKAGFNVLPLDEAVRRLAEGSLPSRAAAITFDDGYADNATQALPVLQKHGVPATIFIATGYLDGGRMWNDGITESLRRAPGNGLDLRELGLQTYAWNNMAEQLAVRDAIIMGIKYLPMAERDLASARVGELAGGQLPSNLMMTSAQVREVRRAGLQIGAHTRNHPILSRLSSEESRREVLSGKEDLESLLGEPVTLFAYPNGRPHQDYRTEDVAIVRELGFMAAVSTAWGTASAASDPFQIPRFTPWDRQALRFSARLLQNLARNDRDIPRV